MACIQHSIAVFLIAVVCNVLSCTINTEKVGNRQVIYTNYNVRLNTNDTRTVNKTYKYIEIECCAGYRNSSGKCLPICADCKDGECIKPGVCLCAEGYSNSKNTSICEPICRMICINGDCIGPNECKCRKGYHHFEGLRNICVHDCNKCKDFEHCNYEGKCVCDEGYSLKNNTCTPECTYCFNGECKIPYICECFKGYTRKLGPHSGVICQPQCSSNCHYGICADVEHCICNQGYKHIDNRTSNSCEPKCSKQCVNGNCIAPDVCQCNDGFLQSENNSFICEPSCPTGCVNGICRKPGDCECHKGYAKHGNDNICTPICKDACENGWCVGPNQCKCHTGYEFGNNSLSKCEPFCNVDCVNGICVSPNKCECIDGYRQNTPTSCTPYCDKRCMNGKCGAPNTCDCFPGYKLNTTDSFRCEPVCIKCDNGVCIRPGECKCLDGYYWSLTTAKCVKTCPRCTHGECNDDGECECFTGYIKAANNSYTCVPKCKQACEQGNCVAPNICECKPGYLYTNITTSCSPICERPCTNGFCSEPGICTCQDRYEHSLGSSTECVLKSRNYKIYVYITVGLAVAFICGAAYLTKRKIKFNSRSCGRHFQYNPNRNQIREVNNDGIHLLEDN